MTMKVPGFDDLMQPTLDALRASGGSASVNEMLQYVLAHLRLPADVASQPHTNNPAMTEVEYRLHWARTYLKQAGLLVNPVRGRWELTELGWSAEKIDPPAIVRAVKKQRAERSNQQPVLLSEDEPANSPVGSAGAALQSTESRLLSPTPDLPTYAAVRHFMRIVDGASYWLYRGMYNHIWEARGNPQEQADWADPDEWIPQLLESDERRLALRLWHESGKTVNPRYIRGCWYLATKHELLERNGEAVLRITERGQLFLSEPQGAVVAEMDADEGLVTILRLVAQKGPGKRGDFLPDYGEYCRSYTTYRADAVIKSALYDRLRNLVEQDYIVARGQSYEVTEKGLVYLESVAGPATRATATRSRQSELLRLAKDLQVEAREQLAEFLAEMNPIKFESLVKLLLEEMGYDDVQTTSPTNDKGVDVVANIELGISSVREVIQVKRQKGNVNRTVLDQLRGSLHRFNAVRGTVITTGRFSKGTQEAAFERGAAPITLIDGEKLLDLLIEHQIGVSKKAVDYLEFDSGKLAQFETERDED
jgi:restriction system protein